MSEVSKAVLYVAGGHPNNQSRVTKAVMYVAFTSAPAIPVRKKARGAVRIYAEPES